MKNEKSSNTQVWAVAAALAAVYLIWGSTYFAIRIVVETYPPFLSGAIRMGIAGALMFVVLWLRGHALPTWRQWKALAVMGIFLVLLANGLVNVAETEVSSGLAAIAVASMPLWAAMFSSLKGRHLTRVEWTGLIIGFVGVLWLNAGSDLRGSPIGMICLIIAPISWAWGSVWSRDQDLPVPFISAAGQMLCGAVWMVIVGLALGEQLAVSQISQSSTLALLYLIFFGSIIGFTAYIWLLNHVRAALATSYAYVNPVIAVLLGFTFLDEQFNTQAIGAMLLILFSVIVITGAFQQRAAATPASKQSTVDKLTSRHE